MKIINKISTIGMSHEEWLESRRGTIGGSDAATLCGLNKYSSPYALWCEKSGKIPPAEENEAMRQGRDLESYVAHRFEEETGKKVRKENSILINRDFPFAHANVDRMVIGEKAGLECKTTSVLNLSKFKNGEYPPVYYCQCQHYMMVTGYPKWYLAVLILGKTFLWFEVPRCEEDIEALKRIEFEFYENSIIGNNPPPIDGTDATSESLFLQFPNSNGDTCDLSGFSGKIKEYLEADEQIKRYKSIKEAAANSIKEYMQDCEKGETLNHLILWKSQTRKSFDTKRFEQEHPDIDLSGFYKHSVSRVFKIQEV